MKVKVTVKLLVPPPIGLTLEGRQLGVQTYRTLVAIGNLQL